MSSDRSERVQQAARDQRAWVQRRDELYGQSLDDDDEDTPSTESRPMTDAEVLAAGPDKGQPGTWNPYTFPAYSGPRTLYNLVTGNIDINSAPVGVRRYLDARIKDLLDKTATTQQWVEFIITHALYDEPTTLYKCLLDWPKGEAPSIPATQGITRFPFNNETLYILDRIPADVLEELRVHCLTKSFAPESEENRTDHFWSQVANLLADSINGARSQRQLTGTQKLNIRAVLREYQSGNKTNLEWGDLFLRHCTGNEERGMFTLRKDKWWHSGLFVDHNFTVFKQAERELRVQRQPTTGEAQFLVQAMRPADLSRTRQGVDAIIRECNDWSRGLAYDSVTPELARRILTLGTHRPIRPRMFDVLLNPVGHTNHLLESSNFGTWAHRERGVPAEVLKRIAYLADGSVPTNNRTSTAMLQRIETARDLINTKLAQVAKYGQLDTSDGRRRTREQLHAMADAVREAADEMGDEEEEARPAKKNHQ